jgi:hypothetical protein
MAAVRTFTLPHYEAYPVQVALFKDVRNADFLRSQLLAANPEFDYAFLDAAMVSAVYFPYSYPTPTLVNLIALYYERTSRHTTFSFHISMLKLCDSSTTATAPFFESCAASLWSALGPNLKVYCPGTCLQSTSSFTNGATTHVHNVLRSARWHVKMARQFRSRLWRWSGLSCFLLHDVPLSDGDRLGLKDDPDAWVPVALHQDTTLSIISSYVYDCDDS